MITYDTIEVPLEKNDERTSMTEREAFESFMSLSNMIYRDHSEKNVDKHVFEINPEDNKTFIIRGNAGVEFLEFVFDKEDKLEVIWVMTKSPE